MKKKVLLKSAAAVMSLLTLAPCFGNVVFAVESEEVGKYIFNKYLLVNTATQKDAAEHFGVAKVTIRKNIKKLEKINPALYEAVKKISNQNKRIAGQKNKKCEVSEEVVLEYIKRNRASYNQAAKKFGVSVGTIANRINKLKETNTNSQKRKKCEILADYDFLNPEDEISEFLYDRSI